MVEDLIDGRRDVFQDTRGEAEVEEDTSEVAAPRNTTKPVATSKWDGVLEAISANTPTTCPRRRRTRPAASTEAEEG